jgi:ATP synthase protein I
LCARLSEAPGLIAKAKERRMGDGDDKSDLSADRKAELSSRLRDLDRQLDARRAKDDKPSPADRKPENPGLALALRLGTDFVAGVILGAALGWGVDRLFGTGPWGLIVFLLLGFAAAILTVMRSAGLMKPGPAGPDDLFDGKG